MARAFVGRVEEQAVVAELLRRARAGDAQRLLIRGEAGVGKTRMLDHAIDAAARQGFHYLYVQADRIDGQVPFAALRLARAEPSDLAGDALPALLANAARLPLSRRRAAVNEGLRELLESWTDHGPVLLAIDDLHAADPGSAVAILFAMRHVRHRRLFVVVTTRPPGELAADVGDDLRRFHAAGELDELELGPFDDAELFELAEAVLGTPPSQGLIDVVRTRSGGLPFFAVELLLAMRDADVIVRTGNLADLKPGATAALPARVATAVLHRVFGLGDRVRKLAAASAVLGEVPLHRLGLLAALAQLSPEEADEAFDRLVEARVLIEDGDRYRFAHAIVREALYDDIGPAARARWHGEIAAELARSGAPRDTAAVLEIGRHISLAGGGPDADLAKLLAAAGDAMLTSDPAAATGWYRAAIDRMPPDDPTTIDVQLGLSRSLDLDAQHTEARQIAIAALEQLPAGRQRAAATVIAARTLFVTGHIDRASELLDAAIADPETRSARLLLARAQCAFGVERFGDAQRYLDGALAFGVEGNDRLAADGVAMHLHCSAARFRQGAEAARRLRDGMEQVSAAAQLNLRVSVGSVEAYNFDPNVAITDVESWTGVGFVGGWCSAILAAAYERLGRLDTAIEHALAALASSPSDEDDALSMLYLPVLISCRAERGDIAGAEEALRLVHDLAPTTFLSRYEVAIAHLKCVQGEAHDAAAMLAEAARRELDVGRVNAAGEALAKQVDVALALADPIAARAANALLHDLPRDEEAVAHNMRCLLAQALTEDDDDVAIAARQHALRYGLALDGARALAALGSIRSDAGALTDAYVELERLGSTYRLHQVAAELRRLGKRPPTRRRASGELTVVEQELAALVARGLTNREIAREMNLSPKTVEVYLTRIYAKLGYRSRVELAVAVRSG